MTFRHDILVETEAELLREAKCRNVYNVLGESLTCKIGKRAKITLGCLLFGFQCTTNVSRTYIQASELGLALMLMCQGVS